MLYEVMREYIAYGAVDALAHLLEFYLTTTAGGGTIVQDQPAAVEDLALEEFFEVPDLHRGQIVVENRHTDFLLLDHAGGKGENIEQNVMDRGDKSYNFV